MESAGYDGPPTKRQRFFTEDDDEQEGAVQKPSSPVFSPSSPPPRFFTDGRVPDAVPGPASPPLHLQSPLAVRGLEDSPSRSLNRIPSPQTHRDLSRSTPSVAPPAPAPMAFDQGTFESFIGETVTPDVLDIIRENCSNNIERAVNMYLDGTWKRFKRKPPASKPMPSSLATTVRKQDRQREPVRPLALHRSLDEPRYIGAFGAEGWATRNGAILRHGDPVRIERQKIQVQPNSRSSVRRVDIMVRFTDTRGNEIGRLSKETAEWVSTLIDQKICKFEGNCVYAPERLRTNDTIYLQLRCSLLASSFLGRGFKIADNRKTGIFMEAESTEEKDLRLRQTALVRLFLEINLVPSRGNAATARNQRQGLLNAAELAEKKEKERSKSADKDNATSSPSDENEDGQELEQDQLDTLYKKAQSFDFNTPEAEPADTFAMTLRPYQKQSLHWMMAKENNERDEDREVSMHPLWEEYTWPTKDCDDQELPRLPGQPTAFYVNPYSGDLSLDFPRQEQHCLGGILADEMGLGKTIQMLALVHSYRSDVAAQARQAASPLTSVNNLPRLPSVSSKYGVVDAPCTTLVVAPMSLLSQWQSEAENASKEGTLKSMVYYGTEKNTDLTTLCCEANAATAPDLIITSYGVVLSEFNQIASKNGGDKSTSRGIFSLNFFRVILDEAHNIKNRQAKTARACYEIAAEHRWVLTGTPIVNRLEDLFSLVRFLRVEPWNNYSFWRTFITVPFESKDFVRALDVVQTVLEPLVMRRTKDMKTPDGKQLVDLPPKTVEIVDIELSRIERDVYTYIFNRAKQTFNANVEAGTVMKSFTSIFAQILRLRQSCCHPVLVRNREAVADEEEAIAAADAAAGLADDMDLQSLIERFTATTDDAADANVFGANVLGQIRDEAVNECPVCTEEPMIEQTVTGCWHSACKKCLLDYIQHQTDRNELPRCFNCREVISERDLFEVVRQDDDPDAVGEGPRISLQRLGSGSNSSKIVSLIKHLRDLRRDNPVMKSVVFSQFTSFLSLIEPALTRANMRFLRLDGSMAQKARVAVLEEFRESKKFTVLLLSLKAGGVGLNLTSAKRVYMMDPWWSFAIEAQAIDRVHRMGQDEEVKVHRFIVKDSVEERMLRIQDRKKFIASSLGMMSDEEKKVQRIEDIRELLS
ncbi:SNF2 family N-terminal domain-containing protein [Podospora appendiculata]|uniref:SNF2 family N-terminal domain-containing protein n=1 Tax=Podospora appendiculata TaxID=314037 RepID=A0AAE1CEX0_9PEZI|nr:SNF2 family N-terminal domain-containing protein [Podospora appendiculata]